MESDEEGSGSDSNTVRVAGGGRANTSGGFQLGAGLNRGGGLQLGGGLNLGGGLQLGGGFGGLQLGGAAGLGVPVPAVAIGASGVVSGQKRGGTLKNKMKLKEIDGAPLK